MLDTLGSDDLVVLRIFARFCDVRDVVSAMRTCGGMRARLGQGAHAALLWERLHLRSWPRASLFRLQRKHLCRAAAAPLPLVPCGVAQCQCYYCVFRAVAFDSARADNECARKSYSWERYRLRAMARRRDLQLCDGVYILTGSSTDARNGNTTPATARIRITSTNLGFSGTVGIGRGTIHNNPAEGTWRGHFGADAGGDARSVHCRAAQEQRSRGSSSRWRLFFEERLPTNDGWFEYEGVVDMKTGTHITGTFKWSMLAGKDRGTFGMTVVEKEETAGAEE